MFSFFFKKKKKGEQSQITQSQPNSQFIRNSNPSQGSPPRQNKSSQNNPCQNKIPEEPSDQWIYEYIYQYLTSPLWKIPIFEFIDENCIVFDTDETNQFAYTECHNNFKKMIEKMLEDTINELGISEEKFMASVDRGLKIEAHKRVFDQLLIVDNFMVFKKLMVKKNKELELEAMKALEQQEKMNATNSRSLERMKLETEQAQIDHAIALSLAIELERKKLLDQEDREFQQALKLSEQEYNESLKNNKKNNEEITDSQFQKTSSPLKNEKDSEIIEKKIEGTPDNKTNPEGSDSNQAKNKAKSPNPKKKKGKKEGENNENDDVFNVNVYSLNVNQAVSEIKTEENLEKKQDNIIEKKENPITVKEQVFQEKKEESKEEEMKNETVFQCKFNKENSTLPPLKADQKFDPLSLSDLLKEKENLAAKLQALNNNNPLGDFKLENKKDEGVETFQERKKRLEKQRELILKKKREERARELKAFKETGGVIGMNEEEKKKAGENLVLQQESSFIDTNQNKIFEKRSEIMKKIKENLD